jgi:hypothetical protein
MSAVDILHDLLANAEQRVVPIYGNCVKCYQLALTDALDVVRSDEPDTAQERLSRLESVVGGSDEQALAYLVHTDPLAHAFVTIGRQIERREDVEMKTLWREEDERELDDEYGPWTEVSGFVFGGYYLPGHVPVIQVGGCDEDKAYRVDCRCGHVGGIEEEAFTGWDEVTSEEWYSHLLEVLKADTFEGYFDRTGMEYTSTHELVTQRGSHEDSIQ